jgi:hypothetical protein
MFIIGIYRNLSSCFSGLQTERRITLMALSITDNIPNHLQTPTCKQSLQVRIHCRARRDAGRVSAEAVMASTLAEYEKLHATRLELETQEPNEDLNRVVHWLKSNNEGENSNE